MLKESFAGMEVNRVQGEMGRIQRRDEETK